MLVKILLLNENPVVTKLVTLSAQKTSDELDIITDIQDLKLQNYDLFAVDDTLYTQEIFDEVKEKVNFSNSLYICSRDTETVEGFTETLRKPFLPTVLVELFTKLDNTQENIEKIQDEIDLTEPLENEVNIQDDGELLNLGGDGDDIGEIDLDDVDKLGSLDKPDWVDDIEDVQLDAEQEDDELDALELDDLNDEDVNDEDLSEEIADETGDKSESILDKDEVEEVQNLLKETEKDDEFNDLDLEDFDLDEDELNLDDLEDADDLSLGDLDDLELDNVEKSPEQENAIQENKEEKSEAVDELSLDNLDDFEDEEIQEEVTSELDIETNKEAMIEELTQEDELNIDDIRDDDLESTIEDAVLGLSKEDLESELDEDALMDIDMSDVDGLESLNTRDIKLAIGEEVEEEIEKESKEIEVDEDESDELQELEVPQDTEISSGKGVKSLKKLLKALSDKDVVASLKGMKININITLSDK